MKKITAPDEQMLTREEAAAWFAARGVRVTKGYLAKLAVQDKGPAFAKIGRTPYYRPADLQAWLDAQTRPTRKAAA